MLQLLREIRADVAVIRREQEGQRRELRDLGRGFVGLSGVVRRQFQRLLQAISDLRVELETTIRIEIFGSSTSFPAPRPEASAQSSP